MHASRITADFGRNWRQSGRAACCVALILAVTAPSVAQAQHTNTRADAARSIRVIVPSAPGGVLDPVARELDTYLRASLGRPVIIDHRPGADGNVGSKIAARSAPDGHTILLASPSLVINPSLYRLDFDPQRDLRGITQLSRGDIVLLAHPSLAAKTAGDLLQLAAHRRRAIAFGTPGSGSQPHLAGELLKQATGVELKHVALKGDPMTSLVDGQVEVVFADAASARPHVTAGRVRALASAGSQRSSVMPELPRLGDSFTGVCIDGWHGVLAPAATPARIVERLQRAIAVSLITSDGRQRFAALGLQVVGSNADDFDRFMLLEYTRYARLIHAANIRLE
jgi:tripartite-type tricarboxylate transporter receptor subunit TctC